jgi:hypothetical protein
MKKTKIFLSFFTIISIFCVVKNAEAVVLHVKSSLNQYSFISECDDLKKQKLLESEDCQNFNKNCSLDYMVKETEADDCYMQMAVKDKNPSICMEKVTPGFGLSDCITEVAIEKEDVSICDYIKEIINFPPDPSIKKDPKDFAFESCNFEFATYTGDPKPCSMMSDVWGIEDTEGCYKYGLNMSDKYVAKDPSLCKKFPLRYKDECYERSFYGIMSYEIPEGTDFLAKNPALCGNFIKSNHIDKCYKKAFDSLMNPVMSYFLSKNPSVCSEFIKTDDKDKCYRVSLDGLKKMDELKYLANNANLCKDYPNQMKQECYISATQGIVKYGLPNSTCEKLLNANYDSLKFVNNLKNIIKFKPLVSDGFSKENCYLKLGLDIKNFSQNDKKFVLRNFISLFILAIVFFTSLFIYIINSKKKRQFSLLIASIFFVSCLISILFLIGNKVFIDVIFFYPILIYISLLSNIVISVVVFKNKTNV